MKRGFTLIELLLAVSLTSLVALAVYANFDSGIRVAQRVNTPSKDEDINVFFEKFSQDLGNAFRYKTIPFLGNETELSFAAPIRTDAELGGDQGIGRVTYFYDESGNAIARRHENVSQIFKERSGNAVAMLRHVESLTFKYFAFDPTMKKYYWTETWSELETNGLIPAAVKIEMVLDEEEGEDEIERTVAVPIGG